VDAAELGSGDGYIIMIGTIVSPKNKSIFCWLAKGIGNNFGALSINSNPWRTMRLLVDPWLENLVWQAGPIFAVLAGVHGVFSVCFSRGIK